uniref:BAT2_N domain-containing protein n=1 Tax=Macrostomum lignano TaxID=282301 RepID=A0A1I8F5G4_9PLAT
PLSEKKQSRTSFSLRVIASLMGFNPAAPGAKPLAPAMPRKAEANQPAYSSSGRGWWPIKTPLAQSGGSMTGQFAANRRRTTALLAKSFS